MPTGRSIDTSYVDHVKRLLVEDRVLLAPVVFEGAMVSRTNTYKGLYFVSFKVFRVLKGSIHRQLTGQVRLLFQSSVGRRGRRRQSLRPGSCPPIPFNVRSGRKYLIFVKQIKSAGRYAAVAEPELVRRKSLKAARQSLACPKCGKLILPVLSDLVGEAGGRAAGGGRPTLLWCTLVSPRLLQSSSSHSSCFSPTPTQICDHAHRVCLTPYS